MKWKTTETFITKTENGRSVGRLVVDGRTTSTRTSAKDEGRPQRASMSRGNIFLWPVNNPFPRPFPSQPAEQGARDGH